MGDYAERERRSRRCNRRALRPMVRVRKLLAPIVRGLAATALSVRYPVDTARLAFFTAAFEGLERPLGRAGNRKARWGRVQRSRERSAFLLRESFIRSRESG